MFDVGGLVEGAHRDCGNAGVADDVFAKGHIVALETDRADVDGEEIGAGGRQSLEAGAFQALFDALALRLLGRGEIVEIGVVLHQPGGDGALQCARRGEGDELVRLGDGTEQVRRRGDVADLPGGHREGLAGGTDADCTVAHAGQRHQGDVLSAVEHQMLVNLVTHCESVVLAHQIGDEGKLVGVEHFGGGIMRRVEQDQLGFVGKRRFQRMARQFPIRRLDADQPGHAAGAAHHRQIAIV